MTDVMTNGMTNAMTRATWEGYWSALEVGECCRQGNMQLFALRHKMPPALDYLTLERALKVGDGKHFRVEEVSPEGSVTELKVINKLKSPVLLVEGEIVTGAKQNRTFHTTVLVNEKSKIIIPVVCVEAGRWSRRPMGGFGLSELYSHANLRYAKLRHVSGSRAAAASSAAAGVSGAAGSPAAAGEGAYQGSPEAYPVNQARVWEEVASFSALGEAPSATSSAEEVYQRFRGRAAAWPEFSCPRDASGIAVAIDGRLSGIECFDRPSTLAEMFPRLIQSYISESMMREACRKGSRDRKGNGENRGESPETAGESSGKTSGKTSADIAAFLRDVAKAEVASAPGVGLGEDLRAQGDDWSAAVLTCQGSGLHWQIMLSGEVSEE